MYENLLNAIGNTPLINIKDEELDNINLYVKLEGWNPTGSVKDRAASYVLNKLLQSGEITKNTTIVESSSGNFGIALANYCKKLGLKFCCVIDPNILPINEKIIRSLAYKVIKVTKRDKTGGFLLTRIALIKEMLASGGDYYWMNQYGNPYVAEAYYNTIGKEICDEVNIDYLFAGVSSGGTITGISRRVKEAYPESTVVAVDTEGSVIFKNEPKKRYIPGIGSSMRPTIIEKAFIDDVMMIEECDAAATCMDLLKNHYILAGGSSGSCFTAIKKYFKGKKFDKKPNVVTIFADRGDRYENTIYNTEWVNKYMNNGMQEVAADLV